MNSDIRKISELESKMHLKGKVIKTNKAGAIVDIGVEKPALLHVSQIILDKQDPMLRVEDALSVDQEIDVYVRNIRNDRIEVSMKEPLPLEWREIKKDMLISGKITKTEKFGAFIEIGAEKPGFIHISELSQGYIRNVSDVVNIGDEVEAKVIEINRRKKQIKLSMKALQPGEGEIDGVTITPARPKRKKGNSKNKSAEDAGSETAEAEPTVMEIALRQAMDKAEENKIETQQRAKKGKKASSQQDDILSRTLNQRS